MRSNLVRYLNLRLKWESWNYERTLQKYTKRDKLNLDINWFKIKLNYIGGKPTSNYY